MNNLTISAIVVVALFFIIFIILALFPDAKLQQSAIGRTMMVAKHCCTRAFKRDQDDDYNLRFLKR